MRIGITKKYRYQKLALESRKICHTLVYLVTLLHSNNTKDVKELWPIYEKMLQRFLLCELHHCIEENVFIFQATFRRGWCINSSILRSFSGVKFYIFLRICRPIVLL